MTSSINKKSYLIVIGLLFFSCGESERQAKQNRQNIKTIDLGFHLDEALSIMGPPDYKHKFYSTKDLDSLESYDYIDVFLSDDGISFTVNSDSIVIDIHY